MLTEVMRVFPSANRAKHIITEFPGIKCEKSKAPAHSSSWLFLFKRSNFVYYSLGKRATLWHFVHRVFLPSAAEKSQNKCNCKNRRTCLMSPRIYYRSTLPRVITWNLSISPSSISPPSFSPFLNKFIYFLHRLRNFVLLYSPLNKFTFKNFILS